MKQRRLRDGFEDDHRTTNSYVHVDINLNTRYEVDDFVNIKSNLRVTPPENLPEEIRKIFIEAMTCKSVGCFNASATMFRLCLDLATKPLIEGVTEDAEIKPNSRQKRDMGLRLQWLFDNNMLPPDLRELASCIREDANDGAHVGNLTVEELDDMIDFTTVFLDRLISEPSRIREATKRRDQRRLLAKGQK